MEHQDYQKTPEPVWPYWQLLRVDPISRLCQTLDLTRDAKPEDAGDYEMYFRDRIAAYVHPEDRAALLAALSPEHLWERASAARDLDEESCLCRQEGEPVRWIEWRVLYSRRDGRTSISILEQEATQRERQEETRAQALEDRSYIISSLSSLFFSTYYIDLEHGTFRAVVQLRRVEDLLGEEVNYTAALQIYVNHFVHPDDRAEYLRIMGIENLRGSLRWWQPCVAVEYRRLDPGAEGCGWVRATAVLSRTGADDMPKTVVYVAQDITASRRGAEIGG